MKQDNQQNAEQIPQQNAEQIIQQKPKKIISRKVLLKQLNQLLSRQSITVLTNSDGLSGVGKSHLALEFASTHLMNKCTIQFQTCEPSKKQKENILAGKLLLIIYDKNKRIYQLGFCHGPTLSYHQQKIFNNDLLDSLTNLSNSNLINNNEISHSIFNYAKSCKAIPYYEDIFWFDATNNTTLQQGYLTLGKKFKLKSNDPAKQIELVKKLLDTKNNHLLVYDNAKNPNTLQSFLPQKNKNIIITSCCNTWPKHNLLNVDVFTLEESVKFIKETLDSEQGNEDIIKFAKALGRLPLALATACSYLIKKNETIQSYLQEYQKNKEAHLSKSAIAQLAKHDRLALAWTYECFGNQAFKSNLFEVAKNHYECALTLFKKHYGNDHLSVWRVTISSALLFDKLRDFKTAFALINDIYQKLKQVYPDHKLTKTATKLLKTITANYINYLDNSTTRQIKVAKRKREESQKTTLAQQKTNKLFKNGYPLPTPLPLLILKKAKNLFQRVNKKLQPEVLQRYQHQLCQIEVIIHQKNQNKIATRVLKGMIKEMQVLLADTSEEKTNNKNLI